LEDSRKAAETGLKLQDSTALRSSLYSLAVLTGDRAVAEAQIAAVQGRRDEVDFIGVRIQLSTYQGRLKEADTLAADWTARMDGASRGTRVPEGLLNVAINEALVGLVESANARIKSVRDRGTVPPGALDEEMVLCALLQDGPRARAILTDAIEEGKKGITDPAKQLEVVRRMQAMKSLAEGKTAEAIQQLEPVIFDQPHTQQVAIWSIAQLRLQHWLEASKGFQWLVDRGVRAGVGATTPFSRASLARSQAGLGQTAQARQAYESLFEIWKDADADLPLLVQSRQELAKLKN
jgi:hypothetical protein